MSRNSFLRIAARSWLVFSVGWVLLLSAGCRRASQQDVYYEDGKRIARLTSIETKDGEPVAHLVDYTMRLHLSSQRERMQRVAEHFGLDGCSVLTCHPAHFSRRRSRPGFLRQVVSADHVIQPYSYRMLCVTAKGDTLGRMLFRDGSTGVLYTPERLDRKELKELLDYFHVDMCTVYDTLMTEASVEHIVNEGRRCYAYFDGKSLDYHDQTR